MRILYSIPYYLPATAFGGPVKICGALAEDMASRGHDVRVITTDVASRQERLHALHERRNGVEVVRVRNFSQALAGKSNGYAPIWFDRRVSQMLDGVDVVHVFDFFTWLTYRATQRAHQRGIPVVMSAQGSASLDPARGRMGIKRPLFLLIGKKTLRRLATAHAVTQHEASALAGLGVPRHKIEIIPNGIPLPDLERADGERFRSVWGLKKERPVVLFVGRLLAGKGVDLLLEASAEIARRHPDVALVLVGPAENRADLEAAGWRGPNLLLTGLLEGRALQDAFAAASLFILPSYSEGLPMSVLEAMAFGVPALVSPGCNLPEVEAAGAGLTVPITTEAIVDALDSQLSRPEAWPAMGAAARRLVATSFDIARVHDAFEALYRRLHVAARAA